MTGTADVRGTVVVVTHDNTSSLPPVVAELAEAARVLELDGVRLDVLAVDRGSTDGSVEVAASACERAGLPFEAITAPPATRWPATGWAATSDGLRHAVHRAAPPDLLVTLDPEGHHDARQIPDLVRRFRARRTGITIGSRWVRGGSAPGTSLPRRVLSRVAGRLVGVVAGAPGTHDVTTSFRVVHPDVVELIGAEHAALGSYGYHAEFVAVARALGFTVDEVPITFRPRYSGIDALTARDLVEFVRDLPRIRRRVDRVRSEMRAEQTDWAERSGRTRGQGATVDAEFGAVDELATLATAANFTDWILDQFEPHLDGAVLDVGAGLGAVARRIAQRHPGANVIALEPAANVADRLVAATNDLPTVAAHRRTSADWLAAGHAGAYDTVLYVNVLEHIRDDEAELRIAHALLRAGGRVGLFVPALPRLYGSLDHKSGHYRRYRREQLRRIVVDAGFTIERIHHLDLAGVLPYWVMYRLLDVDRLDRTTSRLYDRVLVPLGRQLEATMGPPPIGKNLVVVARRT